MTIVVGYVPKPEGEAALERAVAEAQLRSEDLVVVNSTSGDALVDALVSVALAVLGFLLILATVRNNPEESTGLDGALKTLAGQPFGIWILGAVAVGLICYGLFLMVRSRYQRM